MSLKLDYSSGLGHVLQQKCLDSFINRSAANTKMETI